MLCAITDLACIWILLGLGTLSLESWYALFLRLLGDLGCAWATAPTSAWSDHQLLLGLTAPTLCGSSCTSHSPRATHSEPASCLPCLGTNL